MSPFLRRLTLNARRRRARHNARILANPAPGYPHGRCGFCGITTPNEAVVCLEHVDLLAVDPYLNPQIVLTATEPAEDFPQEALLNRLVTSKG